MTLLDARGALVRLTIAMMGDPDVEEARAQCRLILRALDTPEIRPVTIQPVKIKPARRPRSAGRNAAKK